MSQPNPTTPPMPLLSRRHIDALQNMLPPKLARRLRDLPPDRIAGNRRYWTVEAIHRVIAGEES